MHLAPGMKQLIVKMLAASATDKMHQKLDIPQCMVHNQPILTERTADRGLEQATGMCPVLLQVLHLNVGIICILIRFATSVSFSTYFPVSLTFEVGHLIFLVDALANCCC